MAELEHYGVLGMRWGYRKDPDRAYKKSMKKLKKLDRISTKTGRKAYRLEKKADKESKKKKPGSAIKKTLRRRKKASRYSERSLRYTKKAIRWVKEMDDVFANTELSSITESELNLGRYYCMKLMDDAERVWHPPD